MAQKKAWKTYHELQETTTNAADANESSEDLARQLEDSKKRVGKKRDRESGSSEGVGRRVVRKVTQDEIRLTQTEARNPPGGFRIHVPTYDDGIGHDNDWNPDHRLDMGGYRPGGGVKPTNTLGKPTAQAATKGGNFFSPHAERKVLSTQTITGGNVRKPDAEEVFENHHATEPRSKKPKPNPPARSSRHMSSPTVDLTMDGDFDPFTGIPHGRIATAKQPTRMSQAAKDNDPFAVNESRRAASFTHGTRQSQSSKRRTCNDPRNGSQRSSNHGSARSPPIEIQDSSVEDLGAFRHSPMVIVDSQDATQTSRSRSAKPPKIDLGRGLPESKFDSHKANTKASRGSEQDLQNANSMLNMRPTNQPPKLPQRAQPQDPKDSAGLRNNFKRDSQAPDHPPKAKDRMRACSTNNTSSPDELEGGRTIPTQYSPYKESMGKPQSSASYHSTRQQQSSPVSVHQQSRKRVASPSSDCATEKIFDDERIPIRSIFSKQCVEEQENLALVWQSDEKEFFLVCAEEKVCLPNQDALVTIGKDDVAVSWQHNRDLPKAMLKGSANASSNGTIIIEFADVHGLSACYTLLMHATRDSMKSVPASVEHMEKAFLTQRKTLTEAHRRLWQTMKNGPTIVPGSRRAGWDAIQNQSEDEIRYESGNDRGTLSDILAQQQNARPEGERSRYFAQDSRRSIRQTRTAAIKPRSPTPPPRWSDMNPPVKWQQPVVYPSSGARRVTVYDSDISRLDEGEYLNDNLLGFAIRHIEENMSPSHKAKVHFFNTFFYSTLMRNRRKMDYDAVKRWTKNVDIFNVPYTIVPINNDAHWYFAIICNMQFLDRKLSGIDDQKGDDAQDVADATQSSVIDIDDEVNEMIPPRSTHRSAEPVSDNGEDRDVFAFHDDGRIASGEDAAATSRSKTATGKKQKKKSASMRKYDTNAPVIIMLDSFGHQRTAESTALKRYIQAEAREKRAMDVELSQIQGLNAKGLPEQPNFCDCGVFVIGYLTEFAKDPDAFVKKLLRREMDAEKDFKDFNAPDMRQHMRETLLKVARDQDEERRVHKAQKKAKSAQARATSDASKQASPVRQQQTTEETSTATLRSMSEPAAPASKSAGSSPFPTSQTAPYDRSSPRHASPAKVVNEDGLENELEVSPPVGLTQADGALPGPESASQSSSDSDDEMLDVGDESDDQGSAAPAEVGVNAQLPPNPYTANFVSSATAFTGKGASSTGSVVGDDTQEAVAEIADSQGRGYT